jgi:hypothetical protein
VGSEFAMKLVGLCLVAAFRDGGDLHSQFGDSPFEDNFRRVQRALGGGEAAKGASDGLVIEEVAGTFPLIFILFLLFSLGELGITRGVICGSPGLVSSSSPGVVICGSLGGVDETSDSEVGNCAVFSRTTIRKRPSSQVCIHECQRNR